MEWAGFGDDDAVISQTFRREGNMHDDRESMAIDVDVLDDGRYELVVEVKDQRSGARAIAHAPFWKDSGARGRALAALKRGARTGRACCYRRRRARLGSSSMNTLIMKNATNAAPMTHAAMSQTSFLVSSSSGRNSSSVESSGAAANPDAGTASRKKVRRGRNWNRAPRRIVRARTRGRRSCGARARQRRNNQRRAHDERNGDSERTCNEWK